MDFMIQICQHKTTATTLEFHFPINHPPHY